MMKKTFILLYVCLTVAITCAQTTMEVRHSGETILYSTQSRVLGNYYNGEDDKAFLNLSTKDEDGNPFMKSQGLPVSINDSIVFSSKSFIQAEKKEYHFVNTHNLKGGSIGSRPCNIRLKYSGGKSSRLAKIEILDNADWIHGTYGSMRHPTYVETFLSYAENTTDKLLKCRLVFHWADNTEGQIVYTDTVTVFSHPIEIIPFEGISAPEGGIMEIPIKGDPTIKVSAETDCDYIHRLPDEVRDGILFVRLQLDANGEEEARDACLNFHIMDSEREFWIRQPGCHSMTAAEQREAFTAFYHATGGDQWNNNKNWLSDKPLSEWYGLGGYDTYKVAGGGGCATSFNMSDNNLRGSIPVEFAKILDMELHDINIMYNHLSGRIPDEVGRHPQWKKYGWFSIVQTSSPDSHFENYNLRTEDAEIEFFDKDEKSTIYRSFQNHQVNLVVYEGTAKIITGISDGLVNRYLDYRNKGLGLIIAALPWGNTSFDKYKAYVDGMHNIGLPKEIRWAKTNNNKFGSAWASNSGSMFLFDNEGNLIDRWGGHAHASINEFELVEKPYLESLDIVLRKELGEPEEHEPFKRSYYKSTDYSHDGEVLTLQKATVGKGIDLVFMGDMYVDTLLVAGGQYEQDMQASMEHFFNVEPYKSLRDRFNVYAVKAVSPNGAGGSEHKFDFNSKLVFEYAQKVPNVDMDHVSVTVIFNNPNAFYVSGETSMWENGSSIAYIEEGGPSYIICHETGGHGIAKLLDEYVNYGYEDSTIPEDRKTSFKEDFENHHKRGWWLNVSATDNPDEVPWAHFIKDDRYQNEVGICKGAGAYYGNDLWRPSENSIMNDANYLWFNAPSREAIYKTVMQLSEGEGWTYDYEKFVEFDAPIRDVNKRAMAKRGAGNELNTDQRRVELRPPTIYKGSWRDAGKPEKVTSASVPEKYSSPQPGKTSPKRPVRIAQYDNEKMTLKPYYVYKRERMEVAP